MKWCALLLCALCLVPADLAAAGKGRGMFRGFEMGVASKASVLKGEPIYSAKGCQWSTLSKDVEYMACPCTLSGATGMAVFYFSKGILEGGGYFLTKRDIPGLFVDVRHDLVEKYGRPNEDEFGACKWLMDWGVISLLMDETVSVLYVSPKLLEKFQERNRDAL